MGNVFVPSKNRIENAKLLHYANDNNFPLTVVVEPQEIEKYKSRFTNLKFIVLPKNDGGITYVRNFIKQYTEENNIEYYWQLDDDITNLYYRQGTKMIKDNFIVLGITQQDFLREEFALGGLEYQQFAWSASKPFIINSFCDSCVWVDNTKTKGMRYREYVEGKEDRDFAMQVIQSGNKTARTTLFAFAAPKNGSNAGGLKETFYDLGKEEICVQRMVELWGEEICKKIIKPDGRIDVKINWKNINSKQQSLF